MKNLPIGMYDFKDVIDNNYYYVDKIYEYAIAIGKKECSKINVKISINLHFFANHFFLYNGTRR